MNIEHNIPPADFGVEMTPKDNAFIAHSRSKMEMPSVFGSCELVDHGGNLHPATPKETYRDREVLLENRIDLSLGRVNMPQQAYFQNLSVNPYLQSSLDLSRGIASTMDFGLMNSALNVAEGQGVNVYSEAYAAGELIPVVIGMCGSIAGYAKGIEFAAGEDFRIAPFGNRTGHPTGEFPHYHRRVIDQNTGKTISGGSIKRHRPWDTRSTDKSFWDRF